MKGKPVPKTGLASRPDYVKTASFSPARGKKEAVDSCGGKGNQATFLASCGTLPMMASATTVITISPSINEPFKMPE